MQRSVCLGLIVFLLCFVLCAPLSADQAWQRGRIDDVQKTVETQTLYWMVNTPVTRDEIVYTISVQLNQQLLTGIYRPGKTEGPPPEQWVKTWPVKIQVANDNMFLATPDGSELKLRIVKRKHTEPMAPVTDAELARAYVLPDTSPSESLVGLSSSKPQKTDTGTSVREEPAAEQPQSTLGPVGTVSITTVPYLAEIYVDGKSIGYSPAKLSLPVGRHTVRLEKAGYQPQSKDLTVLENSEFTLYATLEKR